MARYTIKYLDGDSETINAFSVVKQHVEEQYYFGDATGQPVALIPSNGVRAVLAESAHEQVTD